MKQTLIAVTLLFATLCCNAQQWEWAKRASQNATEAFVCTTDASNNVYGAGLGTVVVKYDSSGNLMWSRTISGGSSYPLDMVTDPFGNLYVIGGYSGASYTIGNNILQNPVHPRIQIFLAKFDDTGGILWGKNIGNVSFLSGSGYANLACDTQGHIYASCPYTNNPTIGAYSFTNNDPSDSTNDFLVIKLDSSGSALWAKSYGGKKGDWPMGISLTSSGKIYVAGYFESDSLTFGNTTLIDTNTALYQEKTFLSKLNNSGDAIWAKSQEGTSESVIVTGLAGDNSENAFISGYFNLGSVTFGTVTFGYPLAYVQDGFLVKYDSSGNVPWGKLTQSSVPWYVATDLCDNVWISGYTAAIDTIDGHVLSVPSKHTDPMFIAGWTSTGNFINSSALGSGGDDQSGISLDNAGNVYVCGDYNIDTFYVGPDTLLGGTGAGQEYMFIAKYVTGVNCIPSEDVPQYLRQSSRTITLYPNPATSTITIQYNSTDKAKAAIYDITGRLMGSYPLNGNSTTISIQNLPPGIYQCRVMDRGHNVVTKKLVIMH